MSPDDGAIAPRTQQLWRLDETAIPIKVAIREGTSKRDVLAALDKIRESVDANWTDLVSKEPVIMGMEKIELGPKEAGAPRNSGAKAAA